MLGPPSGAQVSDVDFPFCHECTRDFAALFHQSNTVAPDPLLVAVAYGERDPPVCELSDFIDVNGQPAAEE